MFGFIEVCPILICIILFLCSHNMLTTQWAISQKNIWVENMEFPGVRRVKYEDFIFFLPSRKQYRTSRSQACADIHETTYAHSP